MTCDRAVEGFHYIEKCKFGPKKRGGGVRDCRHLYCDLIPPPPKGDRGHGYFDLNQHVTCMGTPTSISPEVYYRRAPTTM